MIGRIIDQIKRAFMKENNTVQLPPDLIIGSDCVVMSYVSFGSEPYLISIGNKVRIADDVRFFTHDGGAWVLRNMGLLKDADFFGQIQIGDNVHICANMLAKKYKHIKWIPVCLDPYAKQQGISAELTLERDYVEKRLYKRANKILMLSQAVNDYRNEVLINKIVFLNYLVLKYFI